MHALKDPFASEVGLMSAAGIAFMLDVAVLFVRILVRRFRKDEERARR
jgi:hypothetical protein